MSNITTKIYLEKLKLKRKDHASFYDYSLVNYINNTTKIKIICPLHGEFEQQPNNHLNGQGCLRCGRVSQTKIRSSNKEDFINKSNKINNNKYNYSKFIYLSVVGKPTCFSGWDERQQYNKLTCLTQRYIIIDTIE